MTSTQAKERAATDESTNEESAAETGRWQTLVAAGLSSILLFLAFPPVSWSWLAWVAPAGWIWLILRARLPGRRPYWQLYFAGLVLWLLLIHWIRLPHWSAYFGWLALSAYLAVYLPIFVGLTRVLLHRWRVPVIVAAPVVWMGLEFAKGYALTGFSMSLLGHSQSRHIVLIQIADVFGAYGVGFAIIWTAACVTSLFAARNRSQFVWPIAAATAMFAALFAYGQYRLSETWSDPADEPLPVALIQGSIDTTFEEDNRDQTLAQYFELTQHALREQPDTRLIVWPESMYVRPWVEVVDPVTLPADSLFTIEDVKEWANDNDQAATNFVNSVDRPLLVGSPGLRYVGDRVERFNSAQWLAPQQPPIRYHKMHPVIFGEYVPGGEWFPWLYSLTPMPNGLTAGDTAVAMELDGLTLCPNICYENTVPHLIRRHVRQLTDESQPPDALITVTNDGWFWGSSQLDIHLASGVFRSVELRRPLLIAANTGFSADIDPHGRVLRKGPRRASSVVWAELRPWRGESSWYELYGDWASMLCLAICVFAAFTGKRQ